MLHNRLNKQAQPSEANLRLNRQIEEQLAAERLPNPVGKQKPDPKADGSSTFRFASQSDNRGSPHELETRRETSGVPPTSAAGGKFQFHVLADVEEGTASANIDSLKQ